ncbi:MAG TPA: DUF1592 domain-containing protein, partial [Isosphaeraceae bacterium]|nr:DUF1592 domain-containing protein [Isosphaeraceae bacterium]
MRGNCDTLVMGSVLLAVSFLVVPARAEDKKPDKTSARFQDDVAPLLAKYCTKCHGVEKPKGHLNLAAIKDEPEATKARKTWEKVRENLEAGAMPPEDEPQPSSEESKRISEWIDGTLTEAKKNDCTGPVDPGRVTLRRLNRAEYKNTIRDLVGISFQPADDFPSDDVGYGFDNIGDVLSLPPLLLERYFAAAEAIAEQAIVTEPIAPGPAKTFEVEDMNDAGGDSFEEMGRILASEGEVAVTFQAPQNGRYILRARAFAQQAGPEKARMAIRVDGKTVKEFEVAAVRSAPELYEISTELKAGARKIGVAFLNDYYKADDPNPGNRDRNLVIDWIEVQGPAAEKSRELPESHRRIVFRTPRNDDWRDAAHEVIDRFATRAYRRPLTPGEVERLVGFVQMAKENGESFERGIQLAVEAVLVSPHFLFKVESDRGGKRTGAAQPISEFELATRLSFFLWSTMPDDELISLAAKKELRNQLEPQVRRMLKDPKAQALVENFAGQWLQLRLLKTVSPDVGRFPTFNDDLRAAMLKETELFFASIMNEDRSVLEFLDADYSFLNERLARHYGISGVQGDEFRRVALTGGDQRGGLLTQASILTVTS